MCYNSTILAAILGRELSLNDCPVAQKLRYGRATMKAMGNELKCTRCKTSLHPAAQLCWKCGKKTRNYTIEVQSWYEHEEWARDRRMWLARRNYEKQHPTEGLLNSRRVRASMAALSLFVIFGLSYLLGIKIQPPFGLVCVLGLIALGLVFVRFGRPPGNSDGNHG